MDNVQRHLIRMGRRHLAQAYFKMATQKNAVITQQEIDEIRDLVDKFYEMRAEGMDISPEVEKAFESLERAGKNYLNKTKDVISAKKVAVTLTDNDIKLFNKYLGEYNKLSNIPSALSNKFGKMETAISEFMVEYEAYKSMLRGV